MNTENTVRKIMQATLKKQRLLTALLLISVIGVVALSLIPPQILRVIIDDYLSGNTYNSLFPIAGCYFGVLLLIGLFDVAKEALLTIYGQRMTRNIRRDMMKKTATISAGYFSNNESGMVVSYFNNDVEAIQTLFTNGVISMAIDILKIVGILVSIFIFSKWLGIMVLVLVPVIYLITRYFQMKMKKAQLLNRIFLAKVNNHIPESIRNLRMIQSFHKESYMQKKYQIYLQDNFGSIEEVNFYDSIFSPIILVIRASMIAILVILSSGKTSYLGITVGMAAAAIEFISNLFSPIENLGMELQSIQKAAAGMSRVDEYLKEEQDGEKEEYRGSQAIKKGEVTLCFHQVSFAYQKDNPLLQKVSFSIQENETVNIVGRTGAGKSTLFKLILGLLEPDEGTITIGSVDVTKLSNHEKRTVFGYVEQNFHFIRGSVMEQISLHDDTIAFDAVENAMKFVGLHEYILQLPKQYDTIATEHLFSYGQRQLLSIARAIVTNPPILLFDEMTANIDAKTEQTILSVLQSAANGKMLLSISHRQSAVWNDHRILSLQDGKLVEQM